MGATTRLLLVIATNKESSLLKAKLRDVYGCDPAPYFWFSKKMRRQACLAGGANGKVKLPEVYGCEPAPVFLQTKRGVKLTSPVVQTGRWYCLKYMGANPHLIFLFQTKWGVKLASPVVQTGRSNCLKYTGASPPLIFCLQIIFGVKLISPLVQTWRSNCLKYMGANPPLILLFAQHEESSLPRRWCKLEGQVVWSIWVRTRRLFLIFQAKRGVKLTSPAVQNGRSSCLKYMCATPPFMIVQNNKGSSLHRRRCKTEGRVAWSIWVWPQLFYCKGKKSWTYLTSGAKRKVKLH